MHQSLNQTLNLSKTQIVGLSMIDVNRTIKSIVYMHTSLTLKIEAEVEGIGMIYTAAILGTHCSQNRS